MADLLEERTEIRLTKKMKASAVRLSKRLGVSEGEIFRMGLMEVEMKEDIKEVRKGAVK